MKEENKHAEKHILKEKRRFESKIVTGVLYGIGITIIALTLFLAGITVGFNKASFGRDWGEHYNENFGIGHSNTRPSFDKMNMGATDYFPNAHGATGKIIKIETSSLIVADKDNLEKTILITEQTKIQEARNQITIADLKDDDYIVVLGSPNTQGQIEAKIIRRIPSPQTLQAPINNIR